MRFTRLRIAWLWIVMGIVAPPVFAQSSCAQFQWDVSREQALFAAAATPLAAGKTAAAAPRLTANRLYQLKLVSRDQVAFAAPPKLFVASPQSGGAAPPGYAGLASLSLSLPGSYRVSVDGPIWIDALINGTLVKPKDYQTRQGCKTPNKIVEFELSASTTILLQFSDAAESNLRVTITPSPERKQ